MTSSIVVQRGRRQDIPEVVVFLNTTRPTKPVSEAELLEELFTWGLLLARTSQLRGVLRWQAINLVGVVRGFWVWPRQQQRRIGAALLGVVEKAAYDLFCEGVVLLIEPDTPASTRRLFTACGYEAQTLADLNRHWRNALEEVLLPSDLILSKRLREQVTFRDLQG